ncbi:Histidinol-phosphatase [Hexamita inflata]|uniref:histidinol-phosphatase n=1 Tax=Hexamita inflata TaxID=28002 RepID=A0AA86R6T8_9EUKA|nr:Histidinol-phosphatase [Hexamita inflata]
MKRVVYDCHTHTYLCGHAENVPPRVFHKIANNQNMRGFAFCCHNPFINDDFCPSYCMPFSSFTTFLELYRQESAFCAQNYPNLELLLAMEVDYCSDARKTKAFVDLTADFDFLLGSIHNDDELHQISFLSRRDYVSKYVKQWKEAVSTGWFQIMSHYDYFRAYFGDQWYLDNMNQYKDDLEGGIIYLNEINKERARNGEELIALECNTGGIQYGDDKYMPTEQLLQLAINLGIPISIGSDCHYQNEVGRQFKQCFTDLQNMGLKELCYFKKKRMQTYSIQEAIELNKKFDSIND